MSLGTRLFAEFIGTCVLLATVVGSGIMGMQLSDGNAGLALLANASATAGALYVLISILGPISGAHFNPLVTLAARLSRRLDNRQTVAYISVQIVAALGGVLIAHAMFDLPLLQLGTKVRSGQGQWIGEVVATFGLLLTVLLGMRHRPRKVPALVACYILAAYWFTSSTSFANPAVTIARSLTQTFAGIRPGDILAFIAAQVTGGALAWLACKALRPDSQLH